MMSSNSAIMSEDNVIPFGEDEIQISKKNNIIIFFHVIFKALAILAYILFGFFTSGFIITFVVIVVLLALDFWTTKNITGRLLVGLRWWNYVDDEGDSHWVFESRKQGVVKVGINNYDSTLFWIALCASEIFWMIFVLAALLTLKIQWLMVACVGFCLTGANLYGYVRCKVGSKNKIKTAASNFLGQQVISSMFSRFTASSQTSKEIPK